eukprot:2799602-Prymnesium_polylepis.1
MHILVVNRNEELLCRCLQLATRIPRDERIIMMGAQVAEEEPARARNACVSSSGCACPSRRGVTRCAVATASFSTTAHCLAPTHHRPLPRSDPPPPTASLRPTTAHCLASTRVSSPPPAAADDRRFLLGPADAALWFERARVRGGVRLAARCLDDGDRPAAQPRPQLAPLRHVGLLPAPRR